MRLPPNSHAIRVYSGKDSWIYQVVGTVLGEHALVVYALEDGTEPWRTTDVPMRWLRGSSRALAEALREDAINWERTAEYRLAASTVRWLRGGLGYRDRESKLVLYAAANGIERGEHRR